jgi:hypothetical protein
MFPSYESQYSTFNGVMFNINSGKPGGLVLVATGQNVAFANTPLARSLKARIEA